MTGRILAFGAAGLLGRSLVSTAREAGYEVFGCDLPECDIARTQDVEARFREVRPEIAINAAAITDVDLCEREPALAYRANALGPLVLAREAARAGARLVHVSTDYVFSGTKGAPYDEMDEPGPLSVYARSKLEGERAVLEVAKGAAIVVRTAWLFGPGGKSFVSRIPALLRERGAIEAVSDQVSSPTYAPDLARALLGLAEVAAGRLYHVANSGAASYYDVALEAARLLGLEASRVRPIASAALPRLARRPAATPLASVALGAEGIAPLRGWREAFRDYVLAGEREYGPTGPK